MYESCHCHSTAVSTSSQEDIVKSSSQSDGSNTDDNVNNGRFTQETEKIIVSESEEELNAPMFQFFSCKPFENSLFDPLTNKTFMFLTLLYLMISNSLTETAFDRFLKTLLICKM